MTVGPSGNKTTGVYTDLNESLNTETASYYMAYANKFD